MIHTSEENRETVTTNQNTEAFTDVVALPRKTREAYEESLPEMSKPVAKVDDVPEEEFKLSPRQAVVEHGTPQIRVAPLMDKNDDDFFSDGGVPASVPLQPTRINEEEK